MLWNATRISVIDTLTPIKNWIRLRCKLTKIQEGNLSLKICYSFIEKCNLKFTQFHYGSYLIVLLFFPPYSYYLFTTCCDMYTVSFIYRTLVRAIVVSKIDFSLQFMVFYDEFQNFCFVFC